MAKDVRAAYEGDPAAKSYDEIIFSYPGLFGVTVYRIFCLPCSTKKFNFFGGLRSLLCLETYHPAKNFPYPDHINNFPWQSNKLPFYLGI